jgi:hypothetical protein
MVDRMRRPLRSVVTDRLEGAPAPGEPAPDSFDEAER